MNISLPGSESIAAGMNAERIRMEIASQNIANSLVTRTESGDPYRRQRAVFEEVLKESQAAADTGVNNQIHTVQLVRIEPDPSDLKKVYDPQHPDADGDGYVSYPNVDVNREMVDLMMASRAYEANVAAMKFSRKMANEALSIGKK